MDNLSFARTRGDGMENVEVLRNDTNSLPNIDKNKSIESDRVAQTSSQSTTAAIPGAFSIYRSNEDASNSIKLPAQIPQGKLFYLVPHLVNTKKSFSLKNREPKFVPFEPYKAAVSCRSNLKVISL